MIATLRSFLSADKRGLIGPAFVFLSLLASISDPFGGHGMPFWQRFLFWLLVLGVAGGIARLSHTVVERYAPGAALLRKDLLIVILVTLLFTPALWVLIRLLAMPTADAAPDMWSMARYGTIFASGLIILRRGLPGPAEPELEVSQPRIYKRLPDGFSEQILRLTVRDHSVDVVTDQGVHTIRSRFGDAIDEMVPITGHCTHRSHWVTDAAIESVERSGGKIHLRLTNGDLVPVSRKYRPGLEEAGII
ncbi:LytTR family DNA-binding domain-containing protein [Ruegeria marisflavi]|nr:LytTR family DNA-binding domain-containing protein [Ruegeria sp. WL0004]